MLSLRDLACILHVEHTLILTGHIPCARQAHGLVGTVLDSAGMASAARVQPVILGKLYNLCASVSSSINWGK